MGLRLKYILIGLAVALTLGGPVVAANHYNSGTRD